MKRRVPISACAGLSPVVFQRLFGLLLRINHGEHGENRFLTVKIRD